MFSNALPGGFFEGCVILVQLLAAVELARRVDRVVVLSRRGIVPQLQSGPLAGISCLASFGHLPRARRC